jgi:LacI family transcriptional regulator
MATIHDVAQDAGVSPTTVSRYLNNRIELPAATSARIDAAIAKFDYRPNVLARRLSTGRTEAIGLVTPEIREPFFAELASAVEDEADRHGYTIFMSSTRSDRDREIAAINRLHDRHVDGLILMTNTADDGTLARLIGKRRSVVLLDEDIPGVNVPRVFVENEPGAHAATSHLIEMGHRRIGFLGGPVGLFSAVERKAGFLRAMREAGLSVDDGMMRLGSFSPEIARQSVQALMRLPSPPTAIFASSDYLGIGAAIGLKAMGLSIPDEVSLVGFDDVRPMTELMQPPLTAVRQPIEALGRRGFLALHALLRGEQPEMLTRLPVELIIRESVAAPNATRRS